ncbi:hypothetical protein UK23_19355 [Lentzea aerocolonigenes]|uniref:Lipoprotein n=1 Tax=Lentzea aerocolonigenes TaxID=68170 RepID=A0A0F0H2B6_LENAE|nr:hypothetical protein [Lentzea aerocolonigenes]KJK47793.1 hypothetical protein UK23_19355 [Lentzea aerocolonigenes]
MRRFALFVLLCAALTGCASLADLATLQSRIQHEGYQKVSVYHRSNNGTDTLEISASGSDPDKVAEIVWDTYPEHLDRLVITLDGTGKRYTEADLREAFGERQVTEKPDDDADVTKTIVTGVVVAAVTFLLLGAGAVVLVVVLMRRARHRKAQQYLQQQQPYYRPPSGPAA